MQESEPSACLLGEMGEGGPAVYQRTDSGVSYLRKESRYLL